MTLLLDLLIVLCVTGGLAFGYVLMRIAASADAHLDLLTPAMRERLRLAAAARERPRLHGGRATRPPRPV
jgi:hypothetical protein